MIKYGCKDCRYGDISEAIGRSRQFFASSESSGAFASIVMVAAPDV